MFISKFLYLIYSPYSGRPFSLKRVVGGLSLQDGNISSATAFKASYAIESKLELDKSSREEVRFVTFFSLKSSSDNQETLKLSYKLIN